MDISDTSYGLNDITSDLNSWYRRVNSWIWQASSIWEYDDKNQTDLPIATTTLVAAQRDYSLPTVAQKILRIEVQDSRGNWHKLIPIDQSEIGIAIDEYYKTNGLPVYYDLTGNSILLYPSPSSTDVTLASGMKVYFTRDIVEFNNTATNTEPGFVSDFHRILSLGAAQDFSLRFQNYNKVNILRAEIETMKQDLIEFYSSRNLNAKPLKINPSSEGSWGL